MPRGVARVGALAARRRLYLSALAMAVWRDFEKMHGPAFCAVPSRRALAGSGGEVIARSQLCWHRGDTGGGGAGGAGLGEEEGSREQGGQAGRGGRAHKIRGAHVRFD